MGIEKKQNTPDFMSKSLNEKRIEEGQFILVKCSGM